MKNFKLILLLFGFAIKLNAQPDSTCFFLDKTSMATNVLLPKFKTSTPDTTERQTKNLTVLKILKQLRYYAINHSLIPENETITYAARQQMQSNNRIPLVMINYRYDALKSYAIDSSLIYIENGKYRDSLPRNETPFTTDTLFACAPLKEKIYSGTQKFLISRDFLITNLPDPIYIKIDFDDGQGYRNVNYGDEITVSYSSENSKVIKVKFEYAGSLFSESKAASTDEYCQGGYPDVHEFMVTTSTINFPSPTTYDINGPGQWFDPNTGISYAHVYIRYGNGHAIGDLVKPLVFVEGIDFGYESTYHGPASN